VAGFGKIVYRIAGKFGEFDESSLIHQTKIIQISTYNYNLLAESIHLPNVFCQMLETSEFAKHSHYIVFWECCKILRNNNLNIQYNITFLVTIQELIVGDNMSICSLLKGLSRWLSRIIVIE